MRLFTLTLLLVGCPADLDDPADPKGDGDTGELPGIGSLGNETHDIDNVTMTVIGTDSDGLNLPRDLAFSNAVDDELWVVNRTDDTMTIFSDVGTDDQTSRNVRDPAANHFLEEVSSIAFGAALYSESDLPNFGTCQESENTYDGMYAGDDFMGPTLWSSDPEIFGETNPEAVAYLSDLWGMYVNLGSHLDMLHESPLCMGIAWEDDNVYWVFNGRSNAINRVDFQDDHGQGFDDHNDGITDRYVEGDVSRVEDVPSHLEFDPNTAFLYIADTGNNAIKVLDTTTGDRGLSLPRDEPLTEHYQVNDALMWTLIDGEDHDMEQPSGIALVEDTLLVTDHGTGKIFAFDLEGNLVDWVDTGLGEGALMGIVARGLDDLWVVDARNDEVLRLQP